MQGDFRHCDVRDLQKLFGARAEPNGVSFSVWAPNARSVRVTGDFCSWSDSAHWLSRGDLGVWRGFVPGARAGQLSPRRGALTLFINYSFFGSDLRRLEGTFFRRRGYPAEAKKRNFASGAIKRRAAVLTV